MNVWTPAGKDCSLPRSIVRENPVNRRRLLTGLIACPACATFGNTAFAQQAKPKHAPHWSYEGNTGPQAWGKMDSASRVCSAGSQQSPIDLPTGIRAELPTIRMGWKPEAFTVVNNGHTIQCNAAPGNTVEVGGVRYELLQFHFHTPSEHAVAGKRTAMEVHFVHKAPDGTLAVLGVLMVAGAANPAFKAVMATAPAKKGEVKLASPLDPAAMLPADRRGAWRYEGSLTTPPCSEVVNWYVLEQTIAVDQADIDAFRKLFPMNARPLQALNRRFVLRS